MRLLHGQRGLLDSAGWVGAIVECKQSLVCTAIKGRLRMTLIINDAGLFVYLLIWPEDGIIKKEDVRRVYDGSIFTELSLQRSGKAYAT